MPTTNRQHTVKIAPKHWTASARIDHSSRELCGLCGRASECRRRTGGPVPCECEYSCAVTGLAERVQRNLQERRQDVARRVLGRPLEVAHQRGANANALRTYTMPLTPEVSAKARLGMADGCPQAPIKPASAAAWFGQGKKGSRTQSGAVVERAAPMACRRPVLPTAQSQQQRPWRAHAGSPCHTGTS